MISVTARATLAASRFGITRRLASPVRRDEASLRARTAADSKALSWMEVSTDSVYGPQWTHPHPAFSADERFATFASDRGGVTQVYVVELV